MCCQRVAANHTVCGPHWTTRARSEWYPTQRRTSMIATLVLVYRKPFPPGVRSRISVRGQRTFRQNLTDVSDFARIEAIRRYHAVFWEHAHVRRGGHCSRFIGGVICSVASKNATGTRFNLNNANIFGMTHTSQKTASGLREPCPSERPTSLSQPVVAPFSGAHTRSELALASLLLNKEAHQTTVRARAGGPPSQTSKGCLNSLMRAIITAFPAGATVSQPLVGSAEPLVRTFKGPTRTRGSPSSTTQPLIRSRPLRAARCGSAKLGGRT